MRKLGVVLLLVVLLTGCEDLVEEATQGTPAQGQTATVVRVIDGDTVEVRMGGVEQRVRYLGVNTPEKAEPCYEQAIAANIALVQGKEVTLVKDRSDTDQYGRLLRYVYVGTTFVNEELVRQGYAESVLYEPDREFHSKFAALEVEAAKAGRGCHPTGIFDDGSDRR